MSEDIYYMYKKDSAGKLYAIKQTDLKSITHFEQTQELTDIVHKLGYKEYAIDDETYIKSN